MGALNRSIKIAIIPASLIFLFIKCETITTARFYFANNWTNYRFDYIEVPFKLERAVLIPMSVDGSTLDFALDTGSPMIALVGNRKTQKLDLTKGAEVNLGGTGTGIHQLDKSWMAYSYRLVTLRYLTRQRYGFHGIK